MKWKILSWCGTCYVCFAIIVSYAALGRLSAASFQRERQRNYAEEVHGSVGDYQPLDQPDAGTIEIAKEEYFIEVWSSLTCGPCEKFVKVEIPKLKKSGLRYKVFNTDIFPVPNGVKVTPTIRIYRGEILVKQIDGATSMKEIAKYIKVEASLLL